jgi:hypothetical protein
MFWLPGEKAHKKRKRKNEGKKEKKYCNWRDGECADMEGEAGASGHCDSIL